MKRSIINPNKMLFVIVLLATIMTISGSCSKNSSGPGANEVFIQGMAMDPATITVTAGTSIIWTNKDPEGHTVTSTTGLFDSGVINPNGTYTHLFSTAGTFPYACTIHPLITGTVIVH